MRISSLVVFALTLTLAYQNCGRPVGDTNASSASMPTEGVLANWKLDDASMGLMADSATRSFNGSYGGSMTLRAPGVRAGQYAVTFSDRTAHGYVPHDPRFNLNEVSLEAWVKFSSAVDGSGIICKGVCFGGESYCLDYYSQAFRFFVRKGAVYYDVSVPRSATLLGQWHHLVGVASANEVSIYMDGDLMATKPVPAGPINTNSVGVSIGARPQNSATDFRSGALGSIQDASIHIGTLSADEIRARYLNGP